MPRAFDAENADAVFLLTLHYCYIRSTSHQSSKEMTRGRAVARIRTRGVILAV